MESIVSSKFGATDEDLKRWKVLFMHGLESGPKGSKSKAIGHYFTCYTPDMSGILREFKWKYSPLPHKIAMVIGSCIFANLYVH
jgi:hypothetical protein